jgi:hypothetical protein
MVGLGVDVLVVSGSGPFVLAAQKATLTRRSSPPSSGSGDQGCLALVGAAGDAEGSAACISTRSEIRRA